MNSVNAAPLPFRCRSCGADDVRLAIDLGQVPASDSFPLFDDPTPDQTWPLELWVCQSCWLIQLGPVVEMPPEQPSPVVSETAGDLATAAVRTVISAESLSPSATFVEHDSSHGTSWSAHFRDAGLRQVNADEQADLVVDMHHLMHEVELNGVLAQRAAEVAPGGVFVCEFFHALPMVTDTLIDTIRHGHYLYLSLTAAVPAWRRHGLTITSAVRSSAYGGSLRVSARRSSENPSVAPSVPAILDDEHQAGLDALAPIQGVAERGKTATASFRQRLQDLQSAGAHVAGYGAPSKAAVLLAVSGVDRSLLPFTVDKAPSKDGKRIPGAGVPIRNVSTLLDADLDVIVVLTWDIAEEIRRQLSNLYRGRPHRPELFVPLPSPAMASLTPVSE